MRTEIKRSVKDADGKPHQYEYVLHGGREGYQLLNELLAAVGPAAGQLAAVGGNMTPEQRQAALAGEGVDEDIGLDRMGMAAASLAKELLKADQALVDKLFLYTSRDGQPVDAVFDKAYQGNLGEMLSAAAYVVLDNFGKALAVPLAAALPKLALVANTVKRQGESSSTPKQPDK